MVDYKLQKVDNDNIQSFQKGFTLIEFIVVVFIILLLTGAVIPIYRANKEELKLKQSAQVIAYSLRRVSEMAMSSQEIGPPGAKIIPSGGYGLYFEKIVSGDKIVLFADCDKSHLYEPDPNQCGSFPEKIEEIPLEKGVVIDSFFPPSSSLVISFEPPDPTVYVNGFEAMSESQIILSLISDPSKKVIISIQKTGLINVK